MQIKTYDEQIPDTWDDFYAFVGCCDNPDFPGHSRIKHGGPSNSFINDPLFVRLCSGIELIESVSDPAWRSSKSRGTMMVFKKRKINLDDYLREPVRPTFKPLRRWKKNVKPILKEPKIYPFRPPPRRINEDDFSYQTRVETSWVRYSNHLNVIRQSLSEKFEKALDVYRRREDAFLRRSLANKRDYSRRLAKYHRRLSILNKRKEIVKNWQSRDSYVVKRPTGLLNDHPYKRTKILNLGATPIQVLGSSRSVAFNYNDAIWENFNMHHWGNLFVYDPPKTYEMELLNPCLDKGINRSFGQTGPVTFYNNIINYSEGDEIKIACDRLYHDISEAHTSHIADLESKLISKLESKVKRLEVHVGNILAERAQTLNLLTDLSHRFIDILKSKGKLFMKAGKYLTDPKKIADDFLAFKFGIEPLVKDMYGAYNLLQSLTSPVPDTVSFRVNNRSWVSNQVFEDHNGKYEFNGFIEISYVVRYRVSSEFAQLASRTGLINPIEIAWEVLPWSFVVDWFIPVGRAISNLTSRTGFEFHSGTKKVRFRGTVTMVGIPGVGVNRCSSQLYSYIRLKFANVAVEFKNREVLTQPPTLPTTVVFNKNPLTSTHLAEAIALLTQRLK